MNERLSLKTKVQIALLSILSISMIGASLGFVLNFILAHNERTMSSQKEIVASEQLLTESVPNPEEKQNRIYMPGKYKVGDDIKQGIYKLSSTGVNPGFYRIASDSSENSLSLSETDVFPSFTYILLNEGQFFTLVDAQASLLEEAPPYSPADGTYISGRYLVGKDIPEGHYIVYPNQTFGYIEISNQVVSNKDTVIVSKYINRSYAIDLSDGDFLKLSNAYIPIEP